MNLKNMDCFVFDFGGTLSSAPYFASIPPQCPGWFDLFQEHVFRKQPPLFDRWMEGAVCAEDISEIMSPILNMPAGDVLAWMKRGLMNLNLNEAVNKLAKSVKRMGKRTILVTGNIDLFDSVVVPDLGLDETFEVIVNSCRSRSLHKTELWSEAFRLLGDGVGYHNSFLIEDSLKNVQLFQESGGQAHRYLNDENLLTFLKESRLSPTQ